VDIWSNHFNVYVAKGADRFLTPDYIEHTIRPRAIGKFEDLLIATARSPAMLFYLDNWRAWRPPVPPTALRVAPSSACRKGSTRTTPGAARAPHTRRRRRLHTAGRDRRARIFTGWSMARPQQGGDFEFHDWAHDRGEKQVLGVSLKAAMTWTKGSGSSGFWPATRPRCTT